MSAQLESQPKAPYQDYSLDRKAEVLAMVKANDGNVDRTALETGIPHQTIRYWLANSDRFSQIQTQKSVDLAQKLENQAHFYLDLAEGKAAGAPFNHLMTGAAIAIDKMQLLRGLPTSINAEVERQELVVILQSALSAGLEGETIDVTPEPEDTVSPVAQITE